MYIFTNEDSNMSRVDYISKIREFNRFYTVSLGMIGKNYKDPYSIVEARILYEIRTNPGCSAGYLVQLLKLDKGYISRIIKKFIKGGLVVREVSQEDARVSMHYLTDRGTEEADRIIAETNREIEEMLTECSEENCEEICNAMEVIMKYFSK